MLCCLFNKPLLGSHKKFVHQGLSNIRHIGALQATRSLSPAGVTLTCQIQSFNFLSDAQFNSLPATEQSQVAALCSGIFSLEHSEFEEAVIVKFVKGDQQAMNNNDAFNNNEVVSDKKAVKGNQAVSDKKANKDNQAVKTQTAANIRKNSEVEKSEDAFVLPSSKSNSACKNLTFFFFKLRGYIL
jgi:hypothetical protein